MNRTPAICNAALAASAGTGKTFALSSRYLALMASGADPASIVALTFTRKAAGEILARILTRLARAAQEDEEFRILNAQLAESGLPGFPGRAAAQAALRRLVQDLPRLRIGTLDSFFLQILRQFRLEAGIGAELAIGLDFDSPEENLIIQGLLAQTALPAEQQHELLEIFRLATFGEERKSTYSTIARLVQNQYEVFQRVPDERCWGAPGRIWTDGSPPPFPLPPAPDWPAVFSALAAQAETLRGAARSAWDRFTENLRGVQAGSEYEFGRTLDARLYAAFAAAGGHPASVPFGRGTFTLPPDVRTVLSTVFGYVRSAALARHVVRTRGLFRLLAAYRRAHRDHIARTGQLSFNDLAQLLAPASGRLPPRLRILMDSRLDARFRHWLLDEFQDTSLVQWAVIENLIDEVVQNADADRTLFYVGDTKQAIYEWRSGDPRLFRRILAKYNRPERPPAIAELAPLVRSWRSSPAVLETINRVFGHLPGMPVPGADRLQTDWQAVSMKWAGEWSRHEAADKNRSLSGQATLHILPRLGPDEQGPTPISRTAELVRQFQADIPGFERLSVAILTRSNSDGLAMLNALADVGIRAVWAGNSPLLDNALLPAVLSLAILVEHPGHTFARRHVEMSPLAGKLSLAPEALAELGRLVRKQGYAGLVARLAAALDLSALPLEQARLRTLLAVAAEFDRQPDATALRFASFVQSREIPAEETGSNIQILTMHKAKGLEYDIVLLPALGDKGITAKGKPALLVHEQDAPDPIPPVDWILTAPGVEIIESEPPLLAQLALDRQGKALEELRLLYVAMTRARRALHLITTAPAADSKTLRLDNILQKTLAPDAVPDPAKPVWQHGEAEWWKANAPPGPAPILGSPLDFTGLPQAPAEPPLKSHLASQEHISGEGRPGWLFRPEGAEARALGTRIHGLLEQIEWLAPGLVPDIPGAAAGDGRFVAAFLQTPGIHRWFEKPAGNVELLREQAFEALLDGQWLSGKIDRLHLEKDAAGKPVRARILDFKTDQTPQAERHRPQMEIYRQAVATLFGIPPEQIGCTLLFVRAGTAMEL